MTTLNARQARRMSRRFATVGVVVPPERLREITVGAHLNDDVSVDIHFGLAVIELQREQRRAKFEHARRRCAWWLLVAGLFLVVLNLLACMAYAMFSALQAPLV